MRSKFRSDENNSDNDPFVIPNEANLIEQSPNNINFFSDMNHLQELGQDMKIADLEQQFDFLHGAEYCQRGDENSFNLPPPKNINSHDFKFSMIPFSDFNNSKDVNLYTG